MSIIDNIERYMERYDHLIEKQTRRHNKGKILSKEEDDELQKLRPTVFTPLTLLFEILFDTVKTNQEIRRSSRGAAQRGGRVMDAAAEKEAKRLSELESSLLPLLTKIIVYIEENKKKAEKKKEGEEVEDEEERYPDIGTTAKNSAILVIRKIKKWWNDLIQGGSSDLSSKINLKKAIPQLPDNPSDLNRLVDKATAAVHEPLMKIEKLLSNDVKDIASSSVEGIMNALSLIPGIGTTLQLWRLLQNVIVIMSKSVTTMAGAKTEGVALKTNIQGLKGDVESMANGAAGGLAGGLAGAAGGLAGAAGGLGGLAGGLGGAAGGLGGLAGAAGDMAGAAGGLEGLAGAAGDMAGAAGDMAGAAGGLGGLAGAAGDMAGAAGGLEGLAGAAGNMVNAAGGLGGLANAAGGLGGLANVAGDMVNAAGGLKGIAGAAGDMVNAAGGLKGIAGAAGNLVNAAGGIGKIANAVLHGGGPKINPQYKKSNRLRSIKKYKQEYKQSIRDIRKTKKRIMKYFNNII